VGEEEEERECRGGAAVWQFQQREWNVGNFSL